MIVEVEQVQSLEVKPRLEAKQVELRGSNANLWDILTDKCHSG